MKHNTEREARKLSPRSPPWAVTGCIIQCKYNCRLQLNRCCILVPPGAPLGWAWREDAGAAPPTKAGPGALGAPHHPRPQTEE